MTLIERFSAIADRPDDGYELRLKHRYLLLTGVIMSVGGAFWGVLSLLAGLYVESLIPLGYTLLTIVNFSVLALIKNFPTARTVQVFFSLTLPFAFQAALGGFVSSGCMSIWAMLCLIGSLSFDTATAMRWLGMFLVLTIVSGVYEGQLEVPEVIVGGLFAQFSFSLNIVTVATAVFGLTLFFMRLRERTTLELEEKNKMLADSKVAMAENEKMAALGQLVAGVAHELNSPLGAIRASVENMRGALDHATSELPVVLARASDEEIAGVQRLMAAAQSGPITSREERKARRGLKKALGDAGLEAADEFSRTLVDMGVRDDAQSHLPLLQAPQGPALLKSAYELGSLQRNRDTIKVAAERASKIVFALKSYAHPGADGLRTSQSLADQLDTVLTLYHNQIKRGVEVERDYQLDDDVIEGLHDELSQVWTNLIHNALQAMDNSGTLRVRVVALGADRVRVSIEDTGPGIPPKTLPRLFEPFFTTKAAGEGTGLGLSISKDILDKHNGNISVDSSSEGTAFHVELPRIAPRRGVQDSPRGTT